MTLKKISCLKQIDKNSSSGIVKGQGLDFCQMLFFLFLYCLQCLISAVLMINENLNVGRRIISNIRSSQVEKQFYLPFIFLIFS